MSDKEMKSHGEGVQPQRAAALAAAFRTGGWDSLSEEEKRLAWVHVHFLTTLVESMKKRIAALEDKDHFSASDTRIGGG